jgi:hypothetical protein
MARALFLESEEEEGEGVVEEEEVVVEEEEDEDREEVEEEGEEEIEEGEEEIEEEEETGSPLSPPLSLPSSDLGLQHIRTVWPGFLQLWQIFFWSSGQVQWWWPGSLQ